MDGWIMLFGYYYGLPPIALHSLDVVAVEMMGWIELRHAGQPSCLVLFDYHASDCTLLLTVSNSTVLLSLTFGSGGGYYLSQKNKVSFLVGPLAPSALR